VKDLEVMILDEELGKDFYKALYLVFRSTIHKNHSWFNYWFLFSFCWWYERV